jgi:hypothetical protein
MEIIISYSDYIIEEFKRGNRATPEPIVGDIVYHNNSIRKPKKISSYTAIGSFPQAFYYDMTFLPKRKIKVSNLRATTTQSTFVKHLSVRPTIDWLDNTAVTYNHQSTIVGYVESNYAALIMNKGNAVINSTDFIEVRKPDDSFKRVKCRTPYIVNSEKQNIKISELNGNLSHYLLVKHMYIPELGRYAKLSGVMVAPDNNPKSDHIFNPHVSATYLGTKFQTVFPLYLSYKSFEVSLKFE